MDKAQYFLSGPQDGCYWDGIFVNICFFIIYLLPGKCGRQHIKPKECQSSSFLYDIIFQLQN